MSTKPFSFPKRKIFRHYLFINFIRQYLLNEAFAGILPEENFSYSKILNSYFKFGYLNRGKLVYTIQYIKHMACKKYSKYVHTHRDIFDKKRNQFGRYNFFNFFTLVKIIERFFQSFPLFLTLDRILLTLSFIPLTRILVFNVANYFQFLIFILTSIGKKGGGVSSGWISYERTFSLF